MNAHSLLRAIEHDTAITLLLGEFVHRNVIAINKTESALSGAESQITLKFNGNLRIYVHSHIHKASTHIALHVVSIVFIT